MALLIRHMAALRASGCHNAYLFPALKGGTVLRANDNPIGSAAYRRRLRQGLVKVGYRFKEALAWTGHSPRIGGSNYARKCGVSATVIQQMGGWMRPKSAAEYQQMTPQQQFKITCKLALTIKRSCCRTKIKMQTRFCSSSSAPGAMSII